MRIPLGTRMRIILIAVFLVVVGAGVWAFWYGIWRSRFGEPSNGPNYHWQSALAALRDYDFPVALKHLETCRQSWPINPELHFLLARTCRRTEDYEGWGKHLNNAEVLRWPAGEIQFERLLLQAQIGDTRRAEKQLKPLLASGRVDEELVYEAVIKGHLSSLNSNDVVKWATHWIKNRPNAWPAYLYRARAYHQRGHHHNTLRDYQQVLKLKNDNLAARHGVAKLQRLNGMYKEAAVEYQKYLQNEPKSMEALVGLANCYLSIGDRQKTLTVLHKILDFDKDNPAALLMLAHIEINESSPKKALDYLKRAEAKAPNEPDVLQALIAAHRLLDESEQVAKYQRQLKRVIEEAARLQKLEERAKREPTNLALRFEIGTGMLKLEHNQDALLWLRSILQSNPDHRPTHLLLATYFERKNDMRQASYHKRMAEGDINGTAANQQKKSRPK